MKTTLIAFKESAIIKPACLLPHMTRLLDALLSVAPDTVDGIMWVTEGWRPPRHTDDAHTWCNAWDTRSKNVISRSTSDLEIIMDLWGRDASEVLGENHSYQFEAHGEGPGLHLHSEHDPRG